MNFGTSNVKKKSEMPFPYITCGNVELIIKNMTIGKARSGSPRVDFLVETPPIETPGFVGIDGAKGQVGRIRSAYLKSETQIAYFNEQIDQIAEALGVRDKVKAIGNVETIEEFVEKLVPLFCTGKSAHYLIGAEEYRKQDGSNGKGKSLFFPRFRFVSQDPSKVAPFDRNSTYHFKPLPDDTPDNEPQSVEDVDMPVEENSADNLLFS